MRKNTSNAFKQFSMKNKITLLAVAAVISFSACNTTYKNSQTPDDVYFSPVKEGNEIKEETTVEDREERELRMATRDRRWRTMDDRYDYDYSHHPYRYGYGYGYYYNPYYYPYPVYSPNIRFSNPKNTTPRMVNLGSYNPPITTPVKNPKTGQYQTPSNTRTYNNSNSGGSTRRVINVRSRNESGGNDSRTYSPSSGSSGSSSGNTSGGNRPVSRPGRN